MCHNNDYDHFTDGKESPLSSLSRGFRENGPLYHLITFFSTRNEWSNWVIGYAIYIWAQNQASWLNYGQSDLEIAQNLRFQNLIIETDSHLAYQWLIT